MFYTDIEERKKLIISKLEYSKKKRYLENDSKYKIKIDIINKVINNIINKDELGIFISQLEYTFKKKLLKELYSNNIKKMNPNTLKTKTDKAIYILTTLSV